MVQEYDLLWTMVLHSKSDRYRGIIHFTTGEDEGVYSRIPIVTLIPNSTKLELVVGDDQNYNNYTTTSDLDLGKSYAFTLHVRGDQVVLVDSTGKLWASLSSKSTERAAVDDVKAYVCGPFLAGADCTISDMEFITDDQETIQEDFMSRFKMVVGKLIAGSIRLVFEDLYNGFCSVVYLCKVWDNENEGSTATKVFMIVSIASGILSSFAGPIIDMLSVLKLRADSLYDEQQALAGVSSGEDASKQYRMGNTEQDKLLDSQDDKPAPVLSDRPIKSTSRKVQHYRQRTGVVMLANHELLGIILSPQTVLHPDRFVYRALIAAATLNWIMFSLMYFGTSVKCGGDIPKFAWLLFFSGTTISLLVELWTILHCSHGFLMFKNLRFKFLAAICFGRLGHFDTFSDLMTTKLVSACVTKDREHFTWFNLFGHRFNLPADLGMMMIVGLLLIIVMQTLPSFYMLIRKRYMALGLKLNEFTVILAVMEDQLSCAEQH